MRKPFLALALVTLLAATAALSQSASAQATQYWDRDGATAGFGSGVATWNLTNTNWSTSAAGDVATGAWVQTNNASFGGTVGNVTVDAAIQANSIRLVNTAGAYTILDDGAGAAGTLELLTGVIATDTPTASTNAQIFSVPITVTGGGNLIVANNTISSASNVALQAANSYGDLRFTSTVSNPTGRSQVLLNHLSAISANATIRMDRNGAQLGFGSAGVWDGKTVANNIILNEANSAQANFQNNIGVGGSYEIEYTGTISSNATGSNVANLRFILGAGGGPGALNLHNAASYNGTTTFVNGTATLTGITRNSTGADNALPVTTRFIFGAGNTNPTGGYDVNGRSQTITGISTAAGTTGAIGGVINTDPVNMGKLIINANATHPAYTANIGINTVQTAYKTGGLTYTQNDNIAVVLQAGSTGTVTFSRAAGMTYSGGTTIDGGTLAVTNTTGSGTGSGAVAVNAGGTLAGTGRVEGAVNVTGGTLAGTLTIVGPLTFTGGTVAPGASPGTITLSGGGAVVVFDSASTLNYELNGGNTTSTPGNAINDLITGATNLTLDGTLNVTDTVPGSFATATAGMAWRLINYSGNLTNNGLSLGTMPALGGGLAFGLDVSTLGQVNLVVASSVPEASAFLFGGLVCGAFGVRFAAARLRRK